MPNMSKKLQSSYQIKGIGHPAGFCRLCWRFTEEITAGVVVKKRAGNNREKLDEAILTIKRQEKTVWTKNAAKTRLEELINESKAPDARFNLEELLYSFIPEFDYQLIIKLGMESPHTIEFLLDQIEQEMINRERYSKIFNFDQTDEVDTADITRKFSVNQLKICLNPKKNLFTEVAPNTSFCYDHNPNRSEESRRAYQNHRKRITDFENEINRLFNHPTESRFANDSDNDLQALLRKAFDNVFSSTLDRIKALKKAGKKQAEIAKILQVSRQVVSIALKREKSKALEA